MSTKLWGGRFDMPTNKLVESYNATIMLEQRLCPFDIKGSIAHATMLGRQGIITESEANTIIGGLRQVDKEIEDGQFVFDTADEDIHMAIERRMTEIIGPVGGKLHTGRSRNDQTTVDSKMHMRATIREIQQDIVNLQKIIIAKAENNINAIMPGYTRFTHVSEISF